MLKKWISYDRYFENQGMNEDNPEKFYVREKITYLWVCVGGKSITQRKPIYDLVVSWYS
jgi:hypothetical protein